MISKIIRTAFVFFLAFIIAKALHLNPALLYALCAMLIAGIICLVIDMKSIDTNAKMMEMLSEEVGEKISSIGKVSINRQKQFVVQAVAQSGNKYVFFLNRKSLQAEAIDRQLLNETDWKTIRLLLPVEIRSEDGKVLVVYSTRKEIQNGEEILVVAARDHFGKEYIFRVGPDGVKREE